MFSPALIALALISGVLTTPTPTAVGQTQEKSCPKFRADSETLVYL